MHCADADLRMLAAMVCEEDVEEVVSFMRRRLCATPWDQGGALTSSPLPDVQKIYRDLEACLIGTIENGLNNSVLLLGPRSCGKTMVTEHVLAQLQLTFPATAAQAPCATPFQRRRDEFSKRREHPHANNCKLKFDLEIGIMEPANRGKTWQTLQKWKREATTYCWSSSPPCSPIPWRLFSDIVRGHEAHTQPSPSPAWILRLRHSRSRARKPPIALLARSRLTRAT